MLYLVVLLVDLLRCVVCIQRQGAWDPVARGYSELETVCSWVQLLLLKIAVP